MCGYNVNVLRKQWHWHIYNLFRRSLDKPVSSMSTDIKKIRQYWQVDNFIIMQI